MKNILFKILTVFSLIFFNFNCTNTNLYLERISPDNKYIARIEWNRIFPYIQGVDAFLIVREIGSDSVILNKELLLSRDNFAQVEYEIQDMYWESDTLFLKLNRNHYKGPDHFKVGQ